MNNVKVSTKYQIVIPKKVRNLTNIKPGMELELIAFNDRIELIPLRPIKKIKGILKGMDTNIIRDKDRL
jgi:AbrB family looped-hinge helix DNA binding protein